MKRLGLMVLAVALLAGLAWAVERRDIKDVSLAKLAAETQESTIQDGHMSLAWWIPYEYWAASLLQSQNLSPKMAQDMLDKLRPYSILAVVQADVSEMGAFDFYRRGEIMQAMRITYADGQGKIHELKPIQQMNKDVAMLLQQMTPILAQAMGNLGQNMQFFVLADTDAQNNRLVSPLVKGSLKVRLSDHAGKESTATIELPLNSLFKDRRCPNCGRLTKIAWSYCPFDATKLPE